MSKDTTNFESSLRRRLLGLSWALLMASMGACDKVTDVGTPCTIKAPCANGVCGFDLHESYLDSKSSQCEKSCLVKNLDNGTNGAIPANPDVLCDEHGQPAGCLTQAQLDQGSYCSCRCDGPKDQSGRCECPDGYLCTQLFEHGGSYCARPH
ncbi:MAG: hypothetical protein QM778_15675 [Myxococcales bacterium]